LAQALLDLQNPWTVMCLAAHPDDEDGATLTLLRRKYGVHTVTLFSTYGEGGQNAIGPELYEELGAIRARETLAAAEIQGSEAHFLGLRDFGFSKSADEAFRIWNHDEALRRMVQKIRELRPDVMITNHDTVSGHGHHQATGRLALEAFDAAADPARFPEQLGAGLSVWQPQRLFVRVNYEGGTGSKQAEDEAARSGSVVSFNINEQDPLRGKTYAEQALEALRQHASQGPWPQTLPPGGRPPIRYRLARSAQGAPALPANAPTVLEGLSLPQMVAQGLAPLAAKAIMPLYEGNGFERESVLGALVAARKSGMFEAAGGYGDAPRARLMKERLDRALVVASQVKATLTPLSDDVLVHGQSVRLQAVVNNRGRTPVQITRTTLRANGQVTGAGREATRTLAQDQPVVLTDDYAPPTEAAINVPRAEHLYDGHLFGVQIDEEMTLNIGGAEFPLHAKTSMDVAPRVEIVSISPSPMVLTPATVGAHSTFVVRLKNHLRTPIKGGIMISNSAGLTTISKDSGFTLAPNQTQDRRIRVSVRDLLNKGRGGAEAISDNLAFTLMGGGSVVPITRRFVPAAYSDARVAQGLRVGYLPSYDETLKNALAALGVKASELSVQEVSAGRLEDYDTIVIDNRGYQAHPELVAANQRLLDYVSAGGTLLVFYHKNFEWNADAQRSRPQLAPYPLTLGNARITDESAPIRLEEPQHALLNLPNKIGPADFEGWIQERGLYYPKEWDAHYSAPLSSGVAGEQALRGGLLTTAYGRGQYVYTSMVWYRQLRAGVPGAYRLFANLISYGHTGGHDASKRGR
jgi:LmbE family N-acetylglucosaminyl deacetylase